MGFVDLGMGDCRTSIIQEDVELFGRIYEVSGQIWPAQLPFDEAFRPCAVFLALRNPKCFSRQFCNPNRPGYQRYGQHALEVMDQLQILIPATLKSKVSLRATCIHKE